MVYLKKKNKSLVVKLFDYFAAIKEIKFVANVLNISKSKLDFIESSVSSNLFFITTKKDAHIVAISGYDKNPTLIGYHDVFKERYASEFEAFDTQANSFVSELLGFINLLDINGLNLAYYSSVAYEYLLFMSGKEYKIKRYTYMYKNEIEHGKIVIYKQEFYIINKDGKLYFMGCQFPSPLEAKFDSLNLSNYTVDEFINHDLERIYEGIVALMHSKNKKVDILAESKHILDFIKKYYLEFYYHGWHEVGVPTTKEDVQLLKMLAI